MNFRKSLSLLIVMAEFAGMLSGCAGKTKNVTGISDISPAQYEYTSIQAENIMVQRGKEEIPLSELDAPFTFATPAYSGKTLSVYIDGELYETELPNFVLATGIEWFYAGGNSLSADVKDGAFNYPEWMSAKITYADGTEQFVVAEYVEIAKSGNVAEIYCLVGSTTFYVTMPIESNDLEIREDITGDPGNENTDEESDGMSDENDESPDEESEGMSDEGEDLDSESDEVSDSFESNDSE